MAWPLTVARSWDSRVISKHFCRLPTDGAASLQMFPGPGIMEQSAIELETNLRKVWSFTITETVPTKAFSWLKAPNSAFTYTTHLINPWLYNFSDGPVCAPRVSGGCLVSQQVIKTHLSLIFHRDCSWWWRWRSLVTGNHFSYHHIQTPAPLHLLPLTQPLLPFSVAATRRNEFESHHLPKTSNSMLNSVSRGNHTINKLNSE